MAAKKYRTMGPHEKVRKGDEVLMSSGRWEQSGNWTTYDGGVQSTGMKYRRPVKTKKAIKNMKIKFTDLRVCLSGKLLLANGVSHSFKFATGLRPSANFHSAPCPAPKRNRGTSAPARRR